MFVEIQLINSSPQREKKRPSHNLFVCQEALGAVSIVSEEWCWSPRCISHWKKKMLFECIMTIVAGGGKYMHMVKYSTVRQGFSNWRIQTSEFGWKKLHHPPVLCLEFNVSFHYEYRQHIAEVLAAPVTLSLIEIRDSIVIAAVSKYHWYSSPQKHGGF